MAALVWLFVNVHAYNLSACCIHPHLVAHFVLQALIVLHGTPPRSTASCVQLTDVSLNGATWTDSDSQNSSVFAVAEQQADSDDCSGYRTIDTSAVSIKVRCSAYLMAPVY